MSPAVCLAVAGCMSLISGSRAADLGFCPVPMALSGRSGKALQGNMARSTLTPPKVGVSSLRCSVDDKPQQQSSKGVWGLLERAKNTVAAHLVGAAVLMSPVSMQPADAQTPPAAPAKQESGFKAPDLSQLKVPDSFKDLKIPSGLKDFKVNLSHPWTRPN